MPHFYISATHKSSGKTTLSIGLAAALREHGHDIQTFKKGPDYIDPSWLRLASDRPCINLDFYTNPAEENKLLFQHHMQDATIGLIEGNKGLYDGMDIEGKDSNAAMAKLLDAPVIIVLNTQGTIRGVAPLLLGYQQFDKDLNIAGVILNRTGGSRHESKLQAVIENYSDITILGAIGNSELTNMQERHLGLITAQENQDAISLVHDLKKVVKQNIDLHKLEVIANKAQFIPLSKSLSYPSDGKFKGLTIGLFRSSAFGFYYCQDIEVFKRAGVEIIEIDAENTQHLPNVDGIFIGGGFPETHLVLLESNTTLRSEIKQAIENGLACYAECGGLMYLTDKIHWKSQTGIMCNVISAETNMHPTTKGRGYIHLKANSNHPWDAQNTSKLIKAHEFHYSSLEGLSKNTKFAYEIKRGTGITGQQDGIVYKNCLANYAHLRDTQDNHWINNFLQFVYKIKQTTTIN
jgi:cobyrinic acid a,c-diamide synthase